MKVPTASTRESFGITLKDLGYDNPAIVVLGGDLNISTFASLFAKEFPDRFFDLGAAEQNMLSMAAGLAAAGKIPFCSTFAVFGTGRAFDQIRVGIAQPQLNVKLVCTHAGVITGEDGVSAHSLEDLALMTSLPTMTVLTPADGPETAAAVKTAAAIQGPVYIRLYRPATPVIHTGDWEFRFGQIETVKPGEDVTIAACGPMVPVALEAAADLSTRGVSARVLNVSTLKPLDEATLVKAARETGALVTVEEHYIHGGLGSAVAGVLIRQQPVPQEFVALTTYAESGKANELLEKYGLGVTSIIAAVDRAVGRKKKSFE